MNGRNGLPFPRYEPLSSNTLASRPSTSMTSSVDDVSGRIPRYTPLMSNKMNPMTGGFQYTPDTSSSGVSYISSQYSVPVETSRPPASYKPLYGSASPVTALSMQPNMTDPFSVRQFLSNSHIIYNPNISSPNLNIQVSDTRSPTPIGDDDSKPKRRRRSDKTKPTKPPGVFIGGIFIPNAARPTLSLPEHSVDSSATFLQKKLITAMATADSSSSDDDSTHSASSSHSSKKRKKKKKRKHHTDSSNRGEVSGQRKPKSAIAGTDHVVAVSTSRMSKSSRKSAFPTPPEGEVKSNQATASRSKRRSSTRSSRSSQSGSSSRFRSRSTSRSTTSGHA